MKKEAMNLRVRKEAYMGKFQGRKGKGQIL